MYVVNDYDQAKWALFECCKWEGSGNEKEVKRILDKYPSLINEVYPLFMNIYYDKNISPYDLIAFALWLTCINICFDV